MKKYIPLLAVSLFFCLFVYMFYRTEKTLVNQVAISLFSREVYSGLRASITSLMPLRDYFVYSLPEGLWVFCITLTSSFFYLEWRGRKWSLVYIPMLIALIMELFQLLHFTNGRFDWMDIIFSFGFWLLALYCTKTDPDKRSIFQPFNAKAFWCILSYCIVYLAHVLY